MPGKDDEIIVRDPTGKFKILRGGKFYDWEPPTPKKSVATASKPVDEVLQKTGLKVGDDLKERLAEILEAYRKDIRDRFETKSILIRPIADGGLGLKAEEADKIIEDLKRVAGTAEKIEPKKAPVARPEVKIAASRPEPVAEIPGKAAEFVFSPADESEILAHWEKLPKQVSMLKPAEIAKLIDGIIKESGVVLDEMGREKLEKILLTRLKDIRDGFETKDTLYNFAGPQGIALSPEDIEKVLSAAKKKIQVMEEKLKKQEMAKTEQAMEEEKAVADKARLGVEDKVRSKIDERWQEITKKKAAPISVPPELIAPPAAMQARTIATPSLGKTAAGSMADVSAGKPVGTAVTPLKKAGIISTLPQQVVGKGGEKPKPLEIFKPAATQVRRYVPPADNRPRLDDIKHVPKLIGPVEELREMTLIDFRRLAGDPKDAAAKIIEKLRLLERESITKKIAGIKAWHESEISKIYLEISRESLAKGMPASQIISLRTSAGKATLNGEEYQAVMELNRSLRY